LRQGASRPLRRTLGVMSKAISNLAVLLRSMEPELHGGVYAYCVVPREANITGLSPVATVFEAEGLTLVLPEEQATNAGLSVLFRTAWITLTVHSDLQAVGLTAAFASALGQAGISCNVVAGAYHDHIFVPVEQAQQALAALRSLQQESAQ
jgi:uncharacterized protein